MPQSNTLTFGQIEQLWVANGGDPAWAPTMAGIALAESGGNTTSLNDNPSTGDYSVGLWQINYYQGLGPPRTKKYGAPTVLINDPNAQAKAAVDILGGGPGITAWKGDKIGNLAQNGKPLSLAQVQSAVSHYSLGSTADAQQGSDWVTTALNDATFGLYGQAQNAAGAASSAADLVDVILHPGKVVAFWERVGMGALGVSLFVVGLVIYFASTDTGQRTVGEAEKVAPLLVAA